MSTNSDDPYSLACAALRVVAAYDPTYARMNDQDKRDTAIAWAEQIKGTGLTQEHILAGVKSAYGDERKPNNPVGVVIKRARDYRARQASRRVGLELAAPSPERGGVWGEPIMAAYRVDNAIGEWCPQCGAVAGATCEGMTFEGDPKPRARKIPHESRLRVAYRRNNPEGQARAAKQEEQERQWAEKHPQEAARLKKTQNMRK